MSNVYRQICLFCQNCYQYQELKGNTRARLGLVSLITSDLVLIFASVLFKWLFASLPSLALTSSSLSPKNIITSNDIELNIGWGGMNWKHKLLPSNSWQHSVFEQNLKRAGLSSLCSSWLCDFLRKCNRCHWCCGFHIEADRGHSKDATVGSNQKRLFLRYIQKCFNFCLWLASVFFLQNLFWN